MGVVAFAMRREPVPALQTVYCVQAWWRDRVRYAKGKFEQYPDMERALRAGKRLFESYAAVSVYRLQGDATADQWGAPCIIAIYGEVPEVG